MKKLLFCALLAFLPFSLASADLKIATIDLGKAFDQYYKTKEIQSHLREKQEEAQKELQDQVADYQRISDEVSTLDKESKDPTLAPEAQKEKARARDQRGADLQAKGRAIEEFKTERTNELKDELVRRHKEVVDEITKVINDYSGPQGFDLVLDKSSASVTSGVPFVLYNSPKLTDITPDIVKLLNASAPATAAGGAPAGTAPLIPSAASTH
jgi:Skp family chaperone for outer membrane proteins